MTMRGVSRSSAAVLRRYTGMSTSSLASPSAEPSERRRNEQRRHQLTVTEGTPNAAARYYRLTLPMPGMGPDDLTLTAEDGVLSIEGRSNEGSHRDLVVSRRQRLPAGVDVQAAVAGVENGNLMIFAPKAVMRNVDAR
jgi:HSP20 family molecular chaperone IbpA